MKAEIFFKFGLKSRFIVGFITIFANLLVAQQRTVEQIYPQINRTVLDIQESEIGGIAEYGFVYALSGNEGGLGYFTAPNNFQVFSVASNLGAISVAPDNANNRIFCAFGRGSNSDGLYSFDVQSHEFQLIGWYFMPNFVKKLPSGFYFGCDGSMGQNGLFHSTDGNSWTPLEFFNNKNVVDAEVNTDGNLFVAAGNEIYISNGETFNFYETNLVINDIYIRNFPHDNEVYIACGDGTDSDCVYRVEYENGEITGLTFINWFLYPHKLYEYEDKLVVGCLNGEGIYLVEPIQNGNYQQVQSEIQFENVFCFNFYPIYCENFMVGTDIGVLLATNLQTSAEENLPKTDYFLENYPNPFSNSTTISFQFGNEQNLKNEQITISIYNIKGRKVRQFSIFNSQFSIIWDGTDKNGNRAESGVYLYKLKSGNTEIVRKMILLK